MPYVAPFSAFVLLLAMERWIPFGPGVWYPVRVLCVAGVVMLLWRRLPRLGVSSAARSALLGLAVFVVWVGPDFLWPGYRGHWLWQNPLTGTIGSSIYPHHRSNGVFLAFRLAGTVLIVPLVEELFWRAWLMRYLISRDFESVPLGAYAAPAFWICALLFASEHGPYWDVGLMAGVAFNGWMVRTRSLGDCILAHGVANASLAGYVLLAGKWEYWM